MVKILIITSDIKESLFAIFFRRKSISWCYRQTWARSRAQSGSWLMYQPKILDIQSLNTETRMCIQAYKHISCALWGVHSNESILISTSVSVSKHVFKFAQWFATTYIFVFDKINFQFRAKILNRKTGTPSAWFAL